jgi:hypothetical protein
MTSTWTAPPPTAEQARHDELTAQGLKRDSFSGRVVPIVDPSAPVLAPDFVKRLDDQVKAGTLTYEDRKRAEYTELMRLHAKRIEDAHAAGELEAAAHRERQATEAEAARQETRRLFDEAVTLRAEAWRRYEAAAGRNLDGVSLADRATFDREWSAYQARKSIADATAAL